MNNRQLFIIAMMLLLSVTGNAQTVFTEGTVKYKVNVSSITNESVRSMLAGSAQVLYLKGNLARYDFESAVNSTSLFIDHSKSNYVLLRGSSSDKYLSRMTLDQWKNFNKKYSSVKWAMQPGFDSTILNYKVKKASTRIDDKTSVVVYYTEEIMPAIRDYEMLFKDIKGLPLFYILETSNGTIAYEVDNLSFAPVMGSKFQIPESGYKILEIKK